MAWTGSPSTTEHLLSLSTSSHRDNMRERRDQSLEAKNHVRSTTGVLTEHIPPQTPSAIERCVFCLSFAVQLTHGGGKDRLPGPPRRCIREVCLLPLKPFHFNLTSTRRDSALRTSHEPATTTSRHASREKHRHIILASKSAKTNKPSCVRGRLARKRSRTRTSA